MVTHIVSTAGWKCVCVGLCSPQPNLTLTLSTRLFVRMTCPSLDVMCLFRCVLTSTRPLCDVVNRAVGQNDVSTAGWKYGYIFTSTRLFFTRSSLLIRLTCPPLVRSVSMSVFLSPDFCFLIHKVSQAVGQIDVSAVECECVCVCVHLNESFDKVSQAFRRIISTGCPCDPCPNRTFVGKVGRVVGQTLCPLNAPEAYV